MKKLNAQFTTDVENFYYNEKNQLHREDGPALEYKDGSGLYFLDGEHIQGYANLFTGKYITDTEVFNERVLKLKLERLKKL